MLTETQIKTWIDSRSLERGRRYYADGSIQRPRRRGNTLSAECVGSIPQPYHVQVTLEQGQIVDGDCSCPVGEEGHCKHAAALLLAWLYAPEQFTELETLTKSLEERSKEALIYIIERMLERYPDLESILELPFVASGQPPGGAMDAAVIQRQIENLLAPHADEYGYGYNYYAGRQLRQGLAPLLAIGDSYLEHGDWENAAVVFQTIITELLPQRHMFHDESHVVYGLIEDCTKHLGACLAAAGAADSASRQELLKVLFHVRKQGIEEGSDLGYQALEVFDAHASAEEKATLAEWVAAALPEGEGNDHNWFIGQRREAYGGWLLNLQAESLDHEQYLEICRQTGRVMDLVERLLELGRLREAIHAAQEASDYTLLHLADRFVFHGHAAVANDLVWERTAASNDSRLEEWLKQKAAEAGNWKEALQITERLYWQHQSLERYQEIQELAEKLGQWNQRRKAIHARLAEQEAFIRLIEIHLLENDVAAAIERLRQAEEQKQTLYGYLPRLEVAEAAEMTHPHEAVRLYLAEAKRLINARGRENYQAASKVLQHVKRLYETKLADGRAWKQLIQQLRDENRTLRALKEELDRAGL